MQNYPIKKDDLNSTIDYKKLIELQSNEITAKVDFKDSSKKVKTKVNTYIRGGKKNDKC